VGYDVNALLKLRRKRSDTKPQLIKLGHREIEILGLSQGFWTDLYHRAMAVYWPVFFGSAAAIFVALNTVFGTLYDDSSAQQLYARHVYSWRDICWQHRYRNITSVSPQGRVLLDYTKFHELVAEE